MQMNMMMKIISADSAYNWQVGFQDPATAILEGIINFHHDLFFFIITIILLAYYMLVRCVMIYRDTKDKNRKPINITHASFLEIVWTLIPAFILFLIALPSFSLLYSMDEIAEPFMSIKAIGHQWYWTYELMGSQNILINIDSEKKTDIPKTFNLDSNFTFDSYMIPDEDLAKGQLRLLEVDNKLFLPTSIPIRVLITSADVLHSWAVPSFGIKLDSVPGRLNQTLLNIKRPGIFYGQCSEICGVNHAFMPIVVQGIDICFKIEASQSFVDAVFSAFKYKYYKDDIILEDYYSNFSDNNLKNQNDKSDISPYFKEALKSLFNFRLFDKDFRNSNDICSKLYSKWFCENFIYNSDFVLKYFSRINVDITHELFGKHLFCINFKFENKALPLIDDSIRQLKSEKKILFDVDHFDRKFIEPKFYSVSKNEVDKEGMRNGHCYLPRHVCKPLPIPYDSDYYKQCEHPSLRVPKTNISKVPKPDVPKVSEPDVPKLENKPLIDFDLLNKKFISEMKKKYLIDPDILKFNWKFSKPDVPKVSETDGSKSNKDSSSGLCKEQAKLYKDAFWECYAQNKKDSLELSSCYQQHDNNPFECMEQAKIYNSKLKLCNEKQNYYRDKFWECYEQNMKSSFSKKSK